MKALSIKQPWAWLIASGHKTIETRIWSSNYRGELLIVASKGKMTKVMKESFNEQYPGKIDEILYGKALATCKVIDCRPMKVTDELDACCDIYPKAVSWVLSDVKKIEPFDVNGQLNLYEVLIPKTITADKDGKYVCHCGLGAAISVEGKLLCWWHYLGPQGYKFKFSEKLYLKMKEYQDGKKS